MQTAHIEDRLRSFARLMTQNFELKVHFLEGVTPSITTNEMFIPALNDSPKAFLRAKFLVAHESGHDLFSEMNLKAEANKTSLHLGDILNALEDARIEELMIQRFEGLTQDFQENVLEILADWDVEKMPLHEQVLHGLYLRGRGFDTWLFTAEANTCLDDLSYEIQEAVKTQNSFGVLNISKTVFAKIIGLFPSDCPKTDTASGKSARGSSSHPKGSCSHPKGSRRGFVSIPDQIEEQVKSNAIPTRGVVELEDYINYLDGVVPEQETLFTLNSAPFDEYQILIGTLLSQQHYLIAEIHRLMEKRRTRKRRTAYKRGQTSGVVDSSTLWKIATDETAIFKQLHRMDANRIDPDPTSLVFSILLDQSGSMAGGRMDDAKKAVAVLGEVLHKLDIPFAITGYTTEEVLARYIVKTFSESYPAVRTRMVNVRALGGTFTSEQIPFGMRQLQARSERKKILLVVTDVDGIESEYRLERAMAKVKAQGIYLAGVGINTKLMSHYFDRYIELEDLSRLGQEMLRLLLELLW
ncbi:VWA domain-containing protein [Candidatus Poribacteria bacterium]|nr:VWA domain-containing protein [Candidatus Poribacteria bacterium]